MHKLYHLKDPAVEAMSEQEKKDEETVETFVLYTGHDYYNDNKLDWLAFYEELGVYLQFFAKHVTVDWADRANYTSVRMSNHGFYFCFNNAYDRSRAMVFKLSFDITPITQEDWRTMLEKDGFNPTQ